MVLILAIITRCPIRKTNGGGEANEPVKSAPCHNSPLSWSQMLIISGFEVHDSTISWWNKSGKLHRMFDFRTIFDFRQILIYLINTMVSLGSWDFVKIFTSECPTLRGQMSKVVSSIAKSFEDVICVYHKSIPVVLQHNSSTLCISELVIPCEQSQVRNEAGLGRLQRIPSYANFENLKNQLQHLRKHGKCQVLQRGCHVCADAKKSMRNRLEMGWKDF